MPRTVVWITVAALGLLSAGPVCAQSLGEIQGVIRQGSGAAVANVRVRVVSQQDGSERLAYTDSLGNYRVPVLEPGLYSLEASAQGFATLNRRDLVIAPNRSLRLDLELAPATTTWFPPLTTIGSALVMALVPAIVALLFTDPGRKIVASLWAGCAWIADWFYRIFAPRFPRRIGLPGYRLRVKRHPFLGRIEHPVGPVESATFNVSLEQAFAPLAVFTDEGRDRADLFAFAAENPHFLVLGGPGTGKTTLMKSLVISILWGRCHERLNHLTPVFVVLREMAAANHTVDQAVAAALANVGFKNSLKFIQTLIEAGQLLIILDGLDEVGGHRPAVAEKIRQFCVDDALRPKRNSLVITCRESSYRTRDLADVVPTTTRVEPFTPQHIRTFLQGWPPYKGRVALRLYRQILADPQILDICKNPLLLTILTGLYLEHERFEIPLSRSAFYKTAIEELLIQRPGRRGTIQKFPDFYKWQILQRISLDRLERPAMSEDPEVFSRERLHHFAREVISPDFNESDFQSLLTELTEVNSIIKTAGDAGFVLGHRTFQEYFAALEAKRTRTVAEVVELFGDRPELAETICFYCGLLDNIPNINSMLEKLLRDSNLLLAGRCLVYAVEPPRANIIQSVSASLLEAVSGPSDSAAELDILASLALRPAQEFETARVSFSTAIDHATSGNDVFGAVSALAASPQRAMAIVPALLRNASAQRRVAGVQLLHDIATDEALDLLVQRVEHGQQPDRGAAAALVANLIRSRNTDLRRRAVLLRERPLNPSVWPFERQFPSRLAIPIIDALEEDRAHLGSVRNAAIVTAVELQVLLRGDKHRRNRRWERVQTYLTLQRIVRAAVSYGTKAAYAVAAMLAVTLIGLYASATLTDRLFTADVGRLTWTVVPRTVCLELARTSNELREHLLKRYPPAPLGLWRVLPWNWTVEPSAPTTAQAIYDDLLVLGTTTMPPHVGYEQLRTGAGSVLPATEATAFLSALADFERQAELRSHYLSFAVVGVPDTNRLRALGFFTYAMLMLVGALFFWRYRRRSTSHWERMIRFEGSRRRHPRDSFGSIVTAEDDFSAGMFAIMAWVMLIPATTALHWGVAIGLFMTGMGFAAGLESADSFELPSNPYTSLAKSLEPITTADLDTLD